MLEDIAVIAGIIAWLAGCAWLNFGGWETPAGLIGGLVVAIGIPVAAGIGVLRD